MAFDYSVPDKIASRAKDNTTTKESLESEVVKSNSTKVTNELNTKRN